MEPRPAPARTWHNIGNAQPALPLAFPLKGGVAVVTGAASGIGAALATVLAARGCGLALADVNAAGLRDAAAQARSQGVTVSEHRLDVADADAVAALPSASSAASSCGKGACWLGATPGAWR